MKTSLVCTMILAAAAACGETTLYVNPQRGSDANPGTADRPFATVARARDAVRALRRAGSFPADGVTVKLAGHFDTLTEPILDLGKADGGPSLTQRVTWEADAGGAFFGGACRLTPADFQPVSGAARARLKEGVRDKVLACDLAKLGVGPLAKLPAVFSRWTEMELLSSGKAMTIARYPNSGWLEITNVIDRGVAPVDPAKGEWEPAVRPGTFEYSGSEPERWDVASGVYLFGFWCHDWASDTLRVAKIDPAAKAITMEGIHRYGLGRRSRHYRGKVRYYAYNILEELDAPGEWYVDREKRVLYFYPNEAGLADVALSLAKKPLARLAGADHVTLRGIDFRHSTGLAVTSDNCRDLVLDGLSVSWMTLDGIRITGGSDNVVANCRIAQIGSAGLSVSGGDRKTLTKCNHVVRDNDIGFCTRLTRIYGPCLRIDGCGVTVEHNYIHDAPYCTFSYGGNEHLIQYNEIECAMLEAGDGAGVYTGRDWGSRGTVVRWNYLHHFGSDGIALRAAQGRPSDCEPARGEIMVEGIYLDDCDSGETVCGNIFYKAGRAMFTGGGRDNHWIHNLVVDCRTAAHFDDRGLRRAKPGSGIRNGWDLLAKIEAFDYTKEPWASRYPELIGIMQKEPLLPIGTYYATNVAVNCGFFFNSWGSATKFLQDRAPNVGNIAFNSSDAARDARDYPQTNALLRAKLETRTDAALAAAAADPLALQDTPAFKAACPGFPRIPVEKIGPRNRRVRR